MCRGFLFCFMKILVTGGAGFIGSHLIESLVSLNHEYIVWTIILLELSIIILMVLIIFKVIQRILVF